MLDFYQHLPQEISPIAFSIGLFSVRWYSLMYLTAFSIIYILLKWRVARDMDSLKFSNNFRDSICRPANKIQNLVLDWMVYAGAGLLIGGRLGYVLLYNFTFYGHNPLSIISPYDFSSGTWTGIFGMSYFGGALGVILASLIFVRRRKISFWTWADFVIPAIPAGYFFGRIGNFLNGELYGRITESAWGMYFPVDFGLALRHPSQIYEAFFEGLVLFLILWMGRNKIKFPGQMVMIYFLGYGFFRFAIEFWRAPDPGANLFFEWLTLGQLLSLSFIAVAGVLYAILSKQKKTV